MTDVRTSRGGAGATTGRRGAWRRAGAWPGRGVLLLAAVLSLWNLAGHDLWAPDEPYFAEGAREMISDGQWAVPHVNGIITTDKPPLFFWLIALLSFVPGQVTELTARLPSVLAALGTVALTVRMGRRLGGGSGGALAGLMLATTYLHWDKARTSQIDALLEFLVLVALTAFIEFRSGAAAGRRAGLLFWGAAAAAVLAKGPVGLLLPLGIVVVTLLTDRTMTSWRQFAPVAGPLLFFALLASWGLSSWLGSGGAYSVWGAFQEHVLRRAVFGMHHAQPPWYYLRVLPVILLPWTGLVPGALLLAWRRRDPADRFLLIFALFIVVFFSLSTEKRDLYVLPACPAFALLAARLADALRASTVNPAPPGGARRALHPRWLTVPLALTATLVAVTGVALLGWSGRIDNHLTMPAVLLGGAMLAAGVLMFAPAAAGRPAPAAVAAAGGVSLVYLTAVTVLLPALNPVMSARPFALQVKQVTAPARAAGAEVLAVGLGNLPEAIAFYSDGVYLREVTDDAEVALHLERPGPAYVVASAARLESLPATLRGRLVTMRSDHLNRKHVLLVANRAGARAAPGAAPAAPAGDTPEMK